MNALLGEHDLSQEQRECVQSIASSAQLMAAIVNDVLDLNKIQAGKLTLTPAPFDLHDMIKDLQEVYHLSIEAKTVNWTTLLGAGVPRTVIGDSTRLRQMLSNLISNAFKFTRQGSIRLSVEVVDDVTELHRHHHYRHNNGHLHSNKPKGMHIQHVLEERSQAYEGEGELVLLDFKVTDTGMGIAPDQIKELFKPYSNVINSSFHFSLLFILLMNVLLND
jgi:signal transduction histidine kinase